jgi:hypothetical protein
LLPVHSRRDVLRDLIAKLTGKLEQTCDPTDHARIEEEIRRLQDELQRAPYKGAVAVVLIGIGEALIRSGRTGAASSPSSVSGSAGPWCHFCHTAGHGLIRILPRSPIVHHARRGS